MGYHLPHFFYNHIPSFCGYEKYYFFLFKTSVVSSIFTLPVEICCLGGFFSYRIHNHPSYYFPFGKVHCSSVCPLGTLQDIITRLSIRLRIKKKRKKFFRYSRPHNGWRYGLITLDTVTFLAGFNFIVNLLDPYSNFGHFITQFAKPLTILSAIIAGNVSMTINQVELIGKNRKLITVVVFFVLIV